jgi:ABC-2 type transport system ATP-binding protein
MPVTSWSSNPSTSSRRKRSSGHLTFKGQPPVAQLQNVPAVRDLRVAGSTVHLVVEGSTADLLEAAAPYRVHQVVTYEPDLEEVFLGYYERKA